MTTSRETLKIRESHDLSSKSRTEGPILQSMSIMQQARPVGRPCATCSHLRRSEIESSVLEGELSIPVIAARFELSPTGLRRHRDRHMLMTADEIASAGLEPADYLAILAGVVERLQAAMDAAELRGDDAALVRAADALRRAAMTLVQFGIRSEDVVLRLGEAGALMRAASRLASTDPGAAELLAAHLDAADRRDLAADLRTLIHKTSMGALTT